MSLPRSLATLSMLAVLSGCFGLSRELRKNGVWAPAQILSIWDTGWTVNDDPVIGMKVRVQPTDRPPFEATVERTAISRLAVPMFQPGRTVAVRFNPNAPTEVEVDLESAPPADGAGASPSGNPFHDRFTRGSPNGAAFLPSPGAPRLYRGTSDSAADTVALAENGYALLGTAAAENTPDSQRALAQGQQVGAALVVLYGRFDPPPGQVLEVLPLQRSAAEPAPIDASMTLVSGVGPTAQVATYWGRLQPPILGVMSRPLDDAEKARLRRSDGIVVEGVTAGSPAAAAHLRLGDVIVAIDGKPLVDPFATPALLESMAGRTVVIDLLRDGAPLSVSVQLNPAPVGARALPPPS